MAPAAGDDLGLGQNRPSSSMVPVYVLPACVSDRTCDPGTWATVVTAFITVTLPHVFAPGTSEAVVG